MSDGMSDRQLFWHTDGFKLPINGGEFNMCNENCKDCKCGEADVAFATVENINVEISKLETDLTNVQFALDKNNETHKQLLLTQVKLEAALAALKHVRGDKSNV